MSSYNLYNVMSKEVLLTIRTRPEIREEFKKVAELRGATMSTLIHQFMVSLIREEKDREPGVFEKANKLAPQLVTPKSGELNKSNENKKIKNQAS